MPTLHIVAPAGHETAAPFMTRDESATRSITQVRVDLSRRIASLSWWPRHGHAGIEPKDPGAALSFDLVASADLAGADRIA